MKDTLANVRPMSDMAEQFHFFLLLGSYQRLGGSSPNPSRHCEALTQMGRWRLSYTCHTPLRKGDIDGLKLFTRPRQRHVSTDVSARLRFLLSVRKGNKGKQFSDVHFLAYLMDASPIFCSVCRPFNPPGVVIGMVWCNNYDLTTPTYPYVEHTAYHLSSENRCVRINKTIHNPLIHFS